MSNFFAVTDRVAKESLRIAHEKLSFIGTVDRQHDTTFKYQGGAGKNGQTLRVKNPNQYIRRQGSRVMDVQDQLESTQTITVATQDGVDMRFNSQELIQSVDSDGAFDDLSRNYIEPAVAVLCSGIEADFIAACTKATSSIVGTAGTPITTLATPLAARAKLNQHAAPKDGNRYVQVDSSTMGGLINGVAAYFNPSGQIAEQYREGFISRNAMADWYENDRMWTMSNTSDIIGTLNGVPANGATTLTITGFSPALAVGMVFTIGVGGTPIYAVHPETKASYGTLKNFTITAVNNTTEIVVSPAIRYSTTDPAQNVSGTPLITAAMTFVGLASTNYVQGLMYHKEAFQFVTADLPILDDAQKCVRRGPVAGDKGNLSLRVWMASDIRNDELLMRLDILYGMAQLKPEWACRMIGAAGA